MANSKKEYQKQYYINNAEKIKSYMREFRQVHKEKVAFWDRRKKYRRKYGIEVEDFDRMFSEQDGRCLICGKHQVELTKRLAVDHCHTSGQVRGLLCSDCNGKLGWFEMWENNIREYLGRDRTVGSGESILPGS